jgi:hypothetical protein
VLTAVWFQVFGDHQHRNQTAVGGALGGTPVIPPGGLSTSANVSNTANTIGVIGGADITLLNITGNSDALVLGLLTGYASSTVTVAGNASKTDLKGPSLGAYAAYVRGNFSTDASFKADFYSQDTHIQDFTGDVFAVRADQHTNVKNYATAVNVNYKIPLVARYYLEPTAGVIFTRTDYENGAALGLTNGSSTRIQAGARLGNDWTWQGIQVNTTLTGLAYDSVKISGTTLSTSGFSAIASDEGKIFGQVLFLNTLDFGRGLSAVAGADVRFGHELVGVGARGGLRYQW